MKIRLSRIPNEGEMVRLHFSRLPQHSCNIAVYTFDSNGEIQDSPIARASVYGRGVGSSAMEQPIVPLRFQFDRIADLSINPQRQIDLQIKGFDDEDLSDVDFELVDITIGP